MTNFLLEEIECNVFFAFEVIKDCTFGDSCLTGDHARRGPVESLCLKQIQRRFHDSIPNRLFVLRTTSRRPLPNRRLLCRLTARLFLWCFLNGHRLNGECAQEICEYTHELSNSLV